VDEALRVGSSGFLGESDAGESELSLQPPVFGPHMKSVSDEDIRRRVGETSGGVMMKIPEKKCRNDDFFNKGGIEETVRGSGS